MKIRNGFISNSSSSSFIAAIFKTKMKMKDVCLNLDLYSKEDLRRDARKNKMTMEDLATEILCDQGIVPYYHDEYTMMRVQVKNILLNDSVIPASFFYQTEKDILEKYKELSPIGEVSFCIFRGDP